MTTCIVESMEKQEYVQGRGAMLRAKRDFIGLGTNEMSELLGVARRSLQRMENGTAAIPVPVLDKATEIVEGFVGDVINMRTVFATKRPDDGPILLTGNTNAYERAVLARALHGTRVLLQHTADIESVRKRGDQNEREERTRT